MSNSPTIYEIESWLGTSLPSEYREFLGARDIDLAASDLVLLYGRADIIERNETCETKEYCPGFVTIGNDSGDMEFVMSLLDASIHMVDAGSMEMASAECLNTNFSTWLKRNCPIPEFRLDPNEWPVDPLTQVCIYLETEPSSISNLLMIKRQLKINNSIAELKSAVERVPCRISDGISYAKAKVLCRLVNHEDPCVGIRLADDESNQLPIDETA